MKGITSPLKRLLFAFALLTTFSASAALCCDDKGPKPECDQLLDGKFTAWFSLNTTYLYKGLSLTNKRPALHTIFSYALPNNFYVGLWNSNINDVPDITLEMGPLLGWAGESGNFSWDIFGVYYLYPGSEANGQISYFEAYAKFGYAFEHFVLRGRVDYSPDFFFRAGTAVYGQIGVDVLLPCDFTFFAEVGRQSIRKNDRFGAPDYSNWEIGFKKLWKDFEFKLLYSDTDIRSRDCFGGLGICGSRVLFGVDRAFTI